MREIPVRVMVGGAAAANTPVRATRTDQMAFKKADAELQVVWGVLFAPGLPDSQGDVMNPDDIREMMFRFMKADRLNASRRARAIPTSSPAPGCWASGAPTTPGPR